MTRRHLAITTLFLVLLTAALALWTGSNMPPEARLPVRWGLDGRPVLFASKWTALLMPSVMLALNGLFFGALPRFEPRRHELERSQRLYVACWVAVLLWHLTRAAVTLAPELGLQLAGDRLNVASIGVALALVGDQLAKSRRMIVLGIVTPWTLASEDIWIRTHRLGGKLLVAGGLAVFFAALLAAPPATMAVLTAGALLSLLVPTGYSFLLWRRAAR